MPGSNDSIMVAMSGGVDSSVAALLLLRAEHRVAGLFMKNWEEDDRHGPCQAQQDSRDAAAVAAQLGILLHTRNFANEYWDHVFEEFLREYEAGRTPNPDILCNREIKFKTFLEHAEALGAGTIATGHYVRTESRDGRFRLLRGLDPAKDQSYFLYAVGHRQLARTRFPVGELDKREVRALAQSAGLAVHDKKDSTGICFIGERDFRGFLGEFLATRPGPVKTPDGTVLGEHDGLPFYTLGQRKGLGIGGRSDAGQAPWYVLHKDLERNVLYVGQEHEHPWLMSSRLEANTLNWVADEAPAAGTRLMAKLRYRQADQPCTVASIESGRMTLRFDQPQRAATPGQSVVLYRDDECLGGGMIEQTDAPPMVTGALP